MHSDEREPNLLDFTPKYVWREVYPGRWRQLSRVQKAEFAIEVAFIALMFGGAVWGATVGGSLIVFVLSFGGVALLLGAFYWLLTRSIRPKQ